MKNAVEQIKQMLQKKRKIVAIGHLNPDGDAVGSTLALAFLFRKMGHQCDVLLPDAVDYTISWIPGAQNILIYKQKPDETADLIAAADLIFCLDFNDLSRIGDMEPLVRNNVNAKKILIDHHLNPAISDFDIIISTSKISSTAELAYQFIKNYGAQDLMDVDMATALYVGIITDTGSLNYACDNTDVYRNIADLIDMGIDTQYIKARLYNMLPESRLRLLGYGLHVKMKVIKQYRSAYIVLTQNELRSFHYQKGDTENMVNHCISIKDIVFGIIIIEHLDRIQLSFRSRGDFNVSKIATQYFSGGGHKNAAGGSSHLSMEETIAKVDAILETYRKELLDIKI